MASNEQIARCIQALLGGGWRVPKDASPDGIHVAWSLAFFRDSDDQLLEALATWIASDTKGFWPMPGEVRACLAVGADNTLAMAGEDWGRLLQFFGWPPGKDVPSTFSTSTSEPVVDVAEYRGTRTPFYPHPDRDRRSCIVAGVSACGGYTAIGMMTEYDRNDLRKRFVSAWLFEYDLLQRRATSRALLTTTHTRLLAGE